MVAEIRVRLHSEADKKRVEEEASLLGVSQTAFFVLLFRNWIGEIRLERPAAPVSDNKTGGAV